MSSKLSSVKLNSVVKGIQKLYPVLLADSSWDNTGLLVDASYADCELGDEKTNILLTIDLTQSVVEEAIKYKTNLILSYHPFIFRGLKSITHSDPQQSSLIKLIQNNISVYSPHTAIDSAIGGVNDWLCDGVSSSEKDTRKVIEPSSVVEGAGQGRVLTLNSAVAIEELIPKIKQSLGLSHIQVAKPKESKLIKTIAICAGSGGSVFRKVQADLYYTGELSHHEALFFKESGSYVVACNHSNTERGFLQLLAKQLQQELGNVDIKISDTDRDPYETV